MGIKLIILSLRGLSVTVKAQFVTLTEIHVGVYVGLYVSETCPLRDQRKNTLCSESLVWKPLSGHITLRLSIFTFSHSFWGVYHKYVFLLETDQSNSRMQPTDKQRILFQRALKPSILFHCKHFPNTFGRLDVNYSSLSLSLFIKIEEK